MATLNKLQTAYLDLITDAVGSKVEIASSNKKIKQSLQKLFNDILSISLNLPMWTWHLCKDGNYFLYLDVQGNKGVVNCYPFPNNVKRKESGTEVTFILPEHGNKILQSFEMAHFRLIDNATLPYGQSVFKKLTTQGLLTRIKSSILAELNHVAIIHLYAQGFDDEQITDFKLNF